MKKKLLFITPSLYGGGAERVLVLILRHLDPSRYQSVVVMFEPTNDYRDELPAWVKIIVIEGKGKRSFLRLVVALARVIRQENPDIVYTSTYRIHYLSLVTALARKLIDKKIPYLLTEHGNLSWCMQSAKLPLIRSRLIKNKYLYPAGDAVVCVSKGLREDLTTHWAVPQERISVIYNPVELEKIQDMAVEEVNHPWFEKGKDVFIACGRLDPQKNYPLLLQAFAKLSHEHSKARLVILGTGKLEKELVAMTRELGLSDSVDFLGFQRNPFKFIARARAFVLSSVMEGFPMVLIEAMACSTPVISTRCQYGPEEIISDGVNGLLVPVNDEYQLMLAMRKILLKKPFACTLAKEGRKWVEKLDARSVVAEYESVLERIIGAQDEF